MSEHYNYHVIHRDYDNIMEDYVISSVRNQYTESFTVHTACSA